MKAYKFKLRPSPRVARTFEQWLDVCRELYNAALEERRKAWKQCGVSVGYHQQANQLPAIKAERPDIAKVNAQVLQDTLRKLSKAFDAFFRRLKAGEKPGYPRFKSKTRFSSFTFPQAKGAFRLAESRLHLSKIGKVKVHLSRPIEGNIKTCTIKRQVDGWYAILTVEDEPKPLPKTGHAVGIDVGLEYFATLSTGDVIENPCYLRASERELKLAQRKVSKKKRDGSNRRKTVKLLAKKHLKVKRQRTDFAHKLSNQLVREFDVIAVEDLNIAGMVKNHHLAKSISDAAWGTFLNILSQKAESAAKEVIRVPAQYTSQNCSRCGQRVRKTLATREHQCINCGLVLHRDHNAAQNVLARAAPVTSAGVSRHDDSRTFLAFN